MNAIKGDGCSKHLCGRVSSWPRGGEASSSPLHTPPPPHPPQTCRVLPLSTWERSVRRLPPALQARETKGCEGASPQSEEQFPAHASYLKRWCLRDQWAFLFVSRLKFSSISEWRLPSVISPEKAEIYTNLCCVQGWFFEMAFPFPSPLSRHEALLKAHLGKSKSKPIPVVIW